MENGGSGGGGATGGPFQGKLNAAVLRSVLRGDAGDNWESLRLSLEDVWAGVKIAENKASAAVGVTGATWRESVL